MEWAKLLARLLGNLIGLLMLVSVLAVAVKLFLWILG